MEAASNDVLRSGDVEIHTTDGLVLVGGRVVAMSMREYRLLIALVSREGRIVSREDLYRIAWDAPLRNGDRSVDVYVHKLRVKLEEALPGHGSSTRISASGTASRPRLHTLFTSPPRASSRLGASALTKEHSP